MLAHAPPAAAPRPSPWSSRGAPVGPHPLGPRAARGGAPARARRMEEGAVRARSVALAVVPLLAAVLTACGGTAKQGTGEPTTGRFASYDFVENQILVELYAEAGRRAGLPVTVQQGVGTREVVAPALQQGIVDVVVDYLGTAVTFARPMDSNLPRDPAEMHAVLSRTLRGRGVQVLDAAA